MQSEFVVDDEANRPFRLKLVVSSTRVVICRLID